jgi:23S rRNA pseudouridine1911/1915/1917 synthase
LSDELTLEIDGEHHGHTIAAVVRAMAEVPWSRARTLCRDGRVWIDGEHARDDAMRVRRGMRVVVRPTAPRNKLEPGVLERERIVHMDGEVVVVDKPAGLQSVPFGDDDHDSLSQRVTLLLRRIDGKRLPPVRVVQRLDKDTTGLIVFARTKTAERELAQQFRVHSVHRRYLALAHGDVTAGTIRSTLVEDRGDGLRGSWRSPKAPPSSAREATTHVELLERIVVPAGASGNASEATFSWIACRLETGRTHQIRIHLSESGHPLVGEHVYVRGFVDRGVRAPAGLEARTLLHAAELGFEHPSSGGTVLYVREQPRDFVAWRKHLEGLRAGG